jgi:S-adenosylmethionine:tRNA ribosyltransferase-isomerase
VSPGRWSALASRLRPGSRVLLGGGAEAVVESVAPDGEHVLRFSTADVRGLMARFGAAPLPPYVLKRRAPADKARAADLERYQTVYAREDGSIAAPTAGLHFTPGLLSRLEALGVRVAGVTLHVGRGTFQGVACPDVREHRMLAERFSVSQEDARLIASARRAGGRVVAVGTSAVRVLETLARSPGVLQGETDLFVRPGHEFRGTDALVTNFHQPRSTPLLLACAFAGRGRLLGAYREAFELGYRLFSYGDAMLVL